MKFLSQINVNTEYTLPIVDGNNGQVLTTDGNGAVYWGNVSAGVTNLDGLTDVILTSPSSGQLLRYGIPPGSGEANPVWYNFTPTYLTPSSSIDALSDVTISTATTGQILQWSGSQWVNATLSTVEYVSKVQHLVKCGVAVTKGQAVYVTSADGTNMIVGLASNATEATSSKVIGLAASTGAINDQIFVVTEGLIAGLNTSTATAGDPVWLGTGGNLIFGLLNKPVAPAHLVYLGVVTRVQSNNGEIFVNVQNGFELNELHDVLISSPSTGQLIRRDSDGLWKNWTPNYLTSLPTHNHDDRYYTESEIAGFFGGELEMAGYNATNWDTAYGWGNHATAGYLTSFTEADTLSSVTGRGNTTTTRIGVLTSTAINLATAGNLGTWIGGIQDGTTGWAISNNGIGLKADNTTYSGIAMGTGNGPIYFGRTLAGGTGTMASWLEVNSSGTANFKLSRPQHNGSNLALVSEIPTNLNQLTNGPGYITGYTETDTLASVIGRGSIATHAVFTGDAQSRVLYLRGAGNIIQFQDASSANKWEVVGRQDQFYIYKNDGTGSGYKYYIDAIGNHAITGDLSVSGGFSASGYNKSNWDTAYGWGNHATAGYLTSLPAHTHPYIAKAGESHDTVQPNNLGAGDGGFYTVANGYGASGGNDALIHIPYANNDWAHQLAFDWSTGNDQDMWFRTKNNGTWQGWRKVWHDGNFIDNSTNWNTAYNDRITAAAVTGTSTKTLTLTQGDGGTVTATWTDYDTDNDAQVLTWTAPSKELAISNGNSITLDGLATEDYVLSQGFITGESDTLATVTGRGNSTSSNIIVTGGSGTTPSISIQRNIASLSNYWTAVQLEVQATSGIAAMSLHRNGYSHVGIYHDAANQLKFNFNSGEPVLYHNTGTIWGSGNDGAGSGLDADTVDGIHASTFATRQDGARYSTDVNSLMSSGFYNVEGQPANSPVSYGQIIVAKGIDTAFQIAGGYSNNALYFRGQGYGPESGGFYPWRRVWHNDDFSSTNISNWNTAYGWGNHAGLYLPIGGGNATGWVSFSSSTQGTPIIKAVQQDSSSGYYLFQGITGSSEVFRVDRLGNLVLGGAITAVGYNKGNWDTAYGWGNHAGLYLPLSGGTLSGNLNTTAAIAFRDGSGTYSNIIRAAGYPSEGYDSSQTYWMEYRAYGGHHFVLNTDGGVGSGANNMDDFVIWQGAIDGDKLLELTNAGNLTIQGTFTESSSIRFKENIQPLEPALAKVEQLNPVTYTKITSQEEEIGLIAEEVAELFPEVVTYNEAGQPQGIQYQRLSVILLKAMQEQNAVIAALTQRVNKLENK